MCSERFVYQNFKLRFCSIDTPFSVRVEAQPENRARSKVLASMRVMNFLIFSISVGEGAGD